MIPDLAWSGLELGRQGFSSQQCRDWVPALVSCMPLGQSATRGQVSPSPLLEEPLRLDQNPRAHTSQVLPGDHPLPEHGWQELDAQRCRTSSVANCLWGL